MKWIHKCNPEWMRARQVYLTASDVMELLPVTKTGRSRKIGDEQYIRVLARKRRMIYEDECISYDAAARGHILEPYAIRAFNDNCNLRYELFHWDDMIITGSYKPLSYQLAFSPDACDIEQPGDSPNVVVFAEPHAIGEVKSYGVERHLTCGITPPESLEERWQIAVAMATCPSIEEAHIIFYNPSAEYQIFTHCYERDDLADEIRIVLDIEKDFNDFISSFEFKMACYLGGDNELEIFEREHLKSSLNLLS